jgi:hypothetical protein
LKILGRDTSFFDDLGITLKRNAKDEIVAAVSHKTSTESKASTSFDDKEKPSRKARIGAINKLNEGNKKKNSDDSSDSSDDSKSLNESDFMPSDSEEESDDDFSDEISDNDSPMSDDSYDDDENESGKKRKRKSNFLDIFLNKPKKTEKRSKIRKHKKKSRSLNNEIKEFKGEFMSEKAGEFCSKMRDELLEQLEKIGDKLPANTLDELIDELGGPENVAEMTGRKGRIVSTEEGNIQYETRTENDVSLEMLNLVEKQRFMDDEKRVAIISEAASSGISLHSDKRAKNRWRRVHITVELPWSADRAVQQFGRTHRSNQANAPEYVFLISNLAGEKRFASIVAKRLESLGALTHGDRRAAESRDLSKYNIDNKYGRQALEIVMKSIAKLEDPIVSPPEDYSGDFFEDCREGLAGVGLIHMDENASIPSLEKGFIQTHIDLSHSKHLFIY